MVELDKRVMSLPPSENSVVFLDKMTGYEFEELVASILNRLQYGRVEQVLRSQDEGRDILLRSSKGLIVVECKHHPKGSIGRPVVQKLHSAVIHSQALKGMLVTTGHFTQEAIEYAQQLSKSGTTIEMIDRPILADMATRARIRLITSRENLTVWTYALPPREQLRVTIGTFVGSIVQAYPRTPQTLVEGERRTIFYRPCYVIAYNINAVFSTTVGVIHRESATNARLVFDANNGQIYSDDQIRFLEVEPQTPMNSIPDEFHGELPTFQVTATSLLRMAKNTIIKLHTRTVSYGGRNNQYYRRTCEPSERDIYISDIRQLYLPLVRIEFGLAKTPYRIEGTQAPSGRLLSTSNNVLQCRICEESIGNGAILCDLCGKITHSGGILLRNVHGFRCKRCKRTTCRDDGRWRRRFLLFRELLCPSCAEQREAQGKHLQRFKRIKNHWTR